MFVVKYWQNLRDPSVQNHKIASQSVHQVVHILVAGGEQQRCLPAQRLCVSSIDLIFAALHRQWWCLYMSKIFSNGTLKWTIIENKKEQVNKTMLLFFFKYMTLLYFWKQTTSHFRNFSWGFALSLQHCPVS